MAEQMLAALTASMTQMVGAMKVFAEEKASGGGQRKSLDTRHRTWPHTNQYTYIEVKAFAPVPSLPGTGTKTSTPGQREGPRQSPQHSEHGHSGA